MKLLEDHKVLSACFKVCFVALLATVLSYSTDIFELRAGTGSNSDGGADSGVGGSGNDNADGGIGGTNSTDNACGNTSDGGSYGGGNDNGGVPITPTCTYNTAWCNSIGWDVADPVTCGYCNCNPGRTYVGGSGGRGGSCQAPVVVIPPVDAKCGATHNTCTAGRGYELGTAMETATQWTWYCGGTNSNGVWGKDAFCTENKPAAQNLAPIGSFEYASCDFAEGWTCDPSLWSKQIDVQIYEGGTMIGRTTANVNREAGVGAACGNGTSAHGFRVALPASFRNGTAHTLTAIALGVSASGASDGSQIALNSPKVTPICPASTVTTNGMCSGSHYACIDGITQSQNDGSSSYTWQCKGINGGTTANCSEAKSATPIAGVCSSARNSCITGSLLDPNEGASSYTWQCAGTNGGATASCSQAKSPTLINGACSATHYSCASGSAQTTADNPSSYTWQCVGTNGGSNAWCSEIKSAPPVHGVCSTTLNTCIAGSGPYEFNDYGGVWAWKCAGTNGGVHVLCVKDKPYVPIVNLYGICGATPNTCAQGDLIYQVEHDDIYMWWCAVDPLAAKYCNQAKSVTPIAGVCSTTRNSCVTGSAQTTADTPSSYTWLCVGTNGGASASCSEAKSPTPIAGVCSTTHYSCVTGSLLNQNEGATSYTWQCVGTNGGATASCSEAKNTPPARVDGVCGGANTSTLPGSVKVYNSTYNQCAKGTSSNTAFPTEGESVSWTCNGSDDGSPASCSAKRLFSSCGVSSQTWTVSGMICSGSTGVTNVHDSIEVKSTNPDGKAEFTCKDNGTYTPKLGSSPTCTPPPPVIKVNGQSRDIVIVNTNSSPRITWELGSTDTTYREGCRLDKGTGASYGTPGTVLTSIGSLNQYIVPNIGAQVKYILTCSGGSDSVIIRLEPGSWES